MKTSTDTKPAHDSPKRTSFIALRANGWSLASIAREINVPKSTLWDWDNKHQGDIHLLKHLQLEKLQEKYLPTYEEELSKLRAYLDRLEDALEQSEIRRIQPAGLLQMILQVLLDPVVVDQRVVNVDQENERVTLCHSTLPSQLRRPGTMREQYAKDKRLARQPASRK